MKEPEKIYDIQKDLLVENRIHIKNYTDNMFIVNLNEEVLAFKKGYVLDSVSININIENTLLKYLGNDTMAFISEKKFEIYDFKINTSIRPYHIEVSSKDSMAINFP